MDIFTFILIAYGITQILVYGKIFQKIRPSKETLRGFFHCPMCVGFWVGGFLLLVSDLTSLYSFDVNLINWFLLSCLSSATSYALCMIIGDDGIQLNL